MVLTYSTSTCFFLFLIGIVRQLAVGSVLNISYNVEKDVERNIVDHRDRYLVLYSCILVEAGNGSACLASSSGIDIRLLARSHSCRDRLLLDVGCATPGRGLVGKDPEGSINCE